jgi:hypothetical protein
LANCLKPETAGSAGMVKDKQKSKREKKLPPRFLTGQTLDDHPTREASSPSSRNHHALRLRLNAPLPPAREEPIPLKGYGRYSTRRRRGSQPPERTVIAGAGGGDGVVVADLRVLRGVRAGPGDPDARRRQGLPWRRGDVHACLPGPVSVVQPWPLPAPAAAAPHRESPDPASTFPPRQFDPALLRLERLLF